MIDMREAQIASWSENAEKWTAAVRGRTIASRREATDAAILAAARAGPLGKTLDLGCGEGWLCRELQSANTEIVGVDVSPELVSRACEHSGASYVVLGYDELRADPMRAGQNFDTIICNFSLLDDELELLLDAMTAISTPRARLLIQTLHPLAVAPPYEDGWRVERFAGFDGEEWTPMPFFCRTLSSWVEAISRNWALKRLLEPTTPTAQIPASLLLVAERH
jgi:2-polyprenyl-3-methyl-5-hydroxy-6-metoxy-1,4-benzoquinol methylase